jgi:hypothetical protein
MDGRMVTDALSLHLMQKLRTAQGCDRLDGWRRPLGEAKRSRPETVAPSDSASDGSPRSRF